MPCSLALIPPFFFGFWALVCEGWLVLGGDGSMLLVAPVLSS